MSLDGLDKWRPYIDQYGVLHPTNEEMLAELRKAQRETLIMNVVASAFLLCALVVGVSMLLIVHLIGA